MYKILTYVLICLSLLALIYQEAEGKKKPKDEPGHSALYKRMIKNIKGKIVDDPNFVFSLLENKRPSWEEKLILIDYTSAIELKEKPSEVLSSELKATRFTPVMNSKIVKNENLIFCSVFQNAWNEFHRKYGDVKIEGAPEYVKRLNKLSNRSSLIDEESYIAMAGDGNDDITGKINKAVKNKFGFLNKIDLPPVLDEKASSNEIIMFSYLYKNIEFNYKADKVTHPLLVQDGDRDLWISVYGNSPSVRTAQFYFNYVVKYFNDTEEINRPKGAVVSIPSGTGSDEIIISTIPVSNTLTETFNKINKLIAKYSKKEYKFHYFIMPELNLNIMHTYDELSSKKILNKNIKSNDFLSKCIQKISININKTGKTWAEKVIFMYYSYETMINTKVVNINYPFVIYLKNKEQKYPYFMAYISNSQLLKEFEMPKYINDEEVAQNIVIQYFIIFERVLRDSRYLNKKNKNGANALILALKKAKYIRSIIDKSSLDSSFIAYEPAQKLFNDFISDIVKSNEIDINAVDNDGKTALMYAIENEESDYIINVLVNAKGTDMNIKRNDGKTVFDLVELTKNANVKNSFEKAMREFKENKKSGEIKK